MNFFLDENYTESFKDIESYLQDNSDDNLTLKIRNMVNRKVAHEKLKKGFTLIYANRMSEANQNLDEASTYDREYSDRIEELYNRYLEDNSRSQAADEILYYLLDNPQPPESRIHELDREVRSRYAAEYADIQDLGFEEFKEKIDNLKDDGEWEEALDLIRFFISENPGHMGGEELFKQVKKEASRVFYSRALEYLENEEYENVRSAARKSRELDLSWYKDQVDDKLEEAKEYMTVGDERAAEELFEKLLYLAPDNPMISLYLGILGEDTDELFEKGLELYNNEIFNEALVRFDLLHLRQPRNEQAQVYYHLSAARHSIREREIDSVRRHLIRALRLEPDNQEAMDIFDRLQDVLEIMG